MDERVARKYNTLVKILPDVAECAQENLVLVGGTALALFHLKHRLSIDLDFIPICGSDVTLKETLKGCLSQKGYQTGRARYANQFVIHFEDTSIKIEIFHPNEPVKEFEKQPAGTSHLLVASLSEILKLKEVAYRERQEARDLFDIVFILQTRRQNFHRIRDLLTAVGPPKNLEELRFLLTTPSHYSFFLEVLKDASRTDH